MLVPIKQIRNMDTIDSKRFKYESQSFKTVHPQQTSSALVLHHHYIYHHHHHVELSPLMNVLWAKCSSSICSEHHHHHHPMINNSERNNPIDQLCWSSCSCSTCSTSVKSISGSSTPYSSGGSPATTGNPSSSCSMESLYSPSQTILNQIPMLYYTAPLPQQTTPPVPAPATTTPTPTMPWRNFYGQLGVFYNPVPWNQSFGMERVWMSEFRRIFSNFYTELWSIQPVDKKPNTNSGIKLHMFVDSAKVRFCCERCSHSWTSMKGRVVFWFSLLAPNFNVGIVAIKLFGQRCDSCNLDNQFEQPMWYPEEVTKVLVNLFNRVGQIFYGFEKTKFERQRRMGKPRTQHNKYLCQACLEGICLNRTRTDSDESSSTDSDQTTSDKQQQENDSNDHVDHKNNNQMDTSNITSKSI